MSCGLDAMAVVGDGHDAGAFEAADGREFLAGDVLGDGAGDENIHDAFACRAFADERDGAGGVQSAGDVFGHADDGGEPAARGGGGAGGKISFAVWPGSRNGRASQSNRGRQFFHRR